MKKIAGINKLIGIVLIAFAITFVSCENEDDSNAESIEKEIVNEVVDPEENSEEATDTPENTDNESSENQNENSEDKEDRDNDQNEEQGETDPNANETPMEDTPNEEDSEANAKQEFVFNVSSEISTISGNEGAETSNCPIPKITVTKLGENEFRFTGSVIENLQPDTQFQWVVAGNKVGGTIGSGAFDGEKSFSTTFESSSVNTEGKFAVCFEVISASCTQRNSISIAVAPGLNPEAQAACIFMEATKK